MELPPTGHDAVLLDEVIESLAVPPGGVAVDCTLGRAGHAAALAGRLGAGGLLIGIDADPRNLEFARQRLAGAPCRARFFHANFAEVEDVLRAAEVVAGAGAGAGGGGAGGAGGGGAHAILADLGVSTNQLFDAGYGLSFASDMPLDMRLDPRLERTAADVVNGMREGELADVLYNLAQERYSRRVARKIAEARRQSPITTTGRLADLVRSAIPRRGGAPERIDPATRTFMALRMTVNRELENLEALLKAAPRLLARGGRLAVISFHSMEDRLVKQAFRALEATGEGRVLTRKPVEATDAEAARNPRSRSAKLRVVERAG